MDLSVHIRDAMVTHARRCLPEEACGLLAVDETGCIRAAYALTNADHSSTAFTIDPDDHFRALTDAEAMGWRIGGVFHSHPVTAAVPSRTDIAKMLEPGWLHVIVGFADGEQPEVRGWWIEGGVATEDIPGVASRVASAAEEGGCR